MSKHIKRDPSVSVLQSYNRDKLRTWIQNSKNVNTHMIVAHYYCKQQQKKQIDEAGKENK
jgi:quinolinate synthase